MCVMPQIIYEKLASKSACEDYGFFNKLFVAVVLNVMNFLTR